jgi:hypothetical protein
MPHHVTDDSRFPPARDEYGYAPFGLALGKPPATSDRFREPSECRAAPTAQISSGIRSSNPLSNNRLENAPSNEGHKAIEWTDWIASKALLNSLTYRPLLFFQTKVAMGSGKLQRNL